MTPTPRTAAAAFFFCDRDGFAAGGHEEKDESGDFVHSDFARQLETELAATQAALREFKPILEIANQLRTQDNRCTADPMFCVQEKRTVYGLDPQWCDNPVWIDTEDGVQECEVPEDEEETEFIKQTGKMEYWETVMVAFTEGGCNDYLRLNGHNHRGKTRIYVESFRRCQEMLAIRGFLMKLDESITKAKEALG